MYDVVNKIGMLGEVLLERAHCGIYGPGPSSLSGLLLGSRKYSSLVYLFFGSFFCIIFVFCQPFHIISYFYRLLLSKCTLASLLGVFLSSALMWLFCIVIS